MTEETRLSVRDFSKGASRKRPVVMVTAYEFEAAGLAESAGVDILLVGDSIGTTVYGFDSTLPVTLEHILESLQAVVRGSRRCFVVADLPFGTYELGPGEALPSARRLIREGGAQAVKIEGADEVVQSVTEALVRSGIPVMGHIGLTPQSVNRLGGFRVQGREVGGADRLVSEALSLQRAGAFALVVECVPSHIGGKIAAEVDIPVIGIGAGGDVDGQVLVWHDLLGLSSGKLPKFVKRYADLRGVIGEALTDYVSEVRTGAFPSGEHEY